MTYEVAIKIQSTQNCIDKGDTVYTLTQCQLINIIISFPSLSSHSFYFSTLLTYFKSRLNTEEVLVSNTGLSLMYALHLRTNEFLEERCVSLHWVMPSGPQQTSGAKIERDIGLLILENDACDSYAFIGCSSCFSRQLHPISEAGNKLVLILTTELL